MAKLVTNTVKKKFTFRLTYADDGAVQIITLKADSYHAAVFGLPRFADVGKYKYELVSEESGK